jgi:hypothetical protein
VPTTSIDTFFACALIVSVAIIATAFLAGAMTQQISGMQNVYKEDYLRNIANHIVEGCGSPVDWGSGSGAPSEFGLAKAACVCEVDPDKVTRLNSQNGYALSYFDAFQAAKLNNIAFGVSVTQMLQVNVELSGSVSNGTATAYTFEVSVNQDSGPASASLHCYVLASGYLCDVYTVASSLGVCSVQAALPNSAGGPGLLVAFARATFDDRLTACAVYPFAHMSVAPEPNGTFLHLSPLNGTLTTNASYPEVSVDRVYALTYTYQANVTSAAAGNYTMPVFTDTSPVVYVAQGSSGIAAFNEWAAYPQVPLDFGADFSNSETHAFVYPVTIDGVLYKLTLRLGGLG